MTVRDAEAVLLPGGHTPTRCVHTQQEEVASGASSPTAATRYLLCTMEQCLRKPDVRKNVKPPKPPPKPKDTPPTPSPSQELGRTQQLIRRLEMAQDEANGNQMQAETRRRPTVAPPRCAEKESKITDQSDQAAADDSKQKVQRSQLGVFQKSQKEKTPTFTIYVDKDTVAQDKCEDGPAMKSPSGKQSSFMDTLKGLQLSLKDSSDEEPTSEKSSESRKPDKHTEPKQDKGNILAGIFRKTPKESIPSPSLTVSGPDAEPVDEDNVSNENLGVAKEVSASNDSLSENNLKGKEKKGIFGGILRKSPKPTEAQDPQSLAIELSASNDSLSEISKTTKDKGGIFSGMFKKDPKQSSESTQPREDEQSLQGKLTVSSESLSENKEKGNLFSGLLKKTPKVQRDSQENLSGQRELSTSNDSLSEHKKTKEKEGAFSGMFKKAFKHDEQSQNELSASNESLSENTKGNLAGHKDLSDSNDSLSDTKKTKEKGNLFSGMFRKSPKPVDTTFPDEDEQSLNSDLLASNESLSETKEKGRMFGVILKKTPKITVDTREDKDGDKKLTASNDSLSEGVKEKSVFGGIFKKPQKQTQEDSEKEESNQPEEGISTSCENLSETTTQKEKKAGLYGLFKRSASIDNLFDNEEKGGLFGGLHKKTPKATGDTTEDKDGDKEITASNDSLSEGNAAKEKSIFGGIFKKPQKPTQEDNSEKEELNQPEEENLASCESLSETTTQKDKKGGLSGLFKRSASIDNLNDNEDKSIFSGIFKKQPKAGEGSTADEDRRIEGNLSVSCDDLSETAMEKTGGLSGMFKRSPKPAQRSQVITDPLHDTNELDERDENLTLKETHTEMSASNDSLNEASTTKEKKRGLGGIFRRTPKTVEQQDEGDLRPPEGGSQLKRRKTITKRKRVVSFRVKRTLPRTAKSSDLAPLVEEESVEMQEMTPIQEGTVEIQPVEMASYSTESNSFDVEEDDELMEWWNGVVGWAEWNETSNFQEEDEEMAVEQAADRLYMAARLFVRIFNQRGASLQQRILELLAQADAADQFHKRTVSAAVGGGVASVAGSVATITGLILAPFTFGASIIVTAVGISVATAGSIASATANITDAVHSNMDRKKVEKMIQGYQDEIKDISECLEFVQEGMNTLQEWDFEKYSQSAAKKALNHNIKHVMKEGGRAGKALVVKTNELISTVQVLSAAGGAAKAVKAVSVTTGVMSALFLALDVFFLAKDSHELRKGAKTKFAKKIREVCKDLQDGLLELNKVKSQLQKTMDGIELEEVEEILEVEEEVEEEEDAGDMLKSDPIKLAKLYEELDIIEEKLDKKVQEDKEKKKEEEESSRQSKEKAERKKDLVTAGAGKEEKSEKEKAGSGGEQQETNKKEEVKDNSKAEHLIKSQSEPEQKTESVKAENATREASWKEPLVKGRKKAKEAENRATTQREHTHSNQAEKADVMPTHEGRKEKGEVMAEDHGNGKIEKEKDSGRSWLGGHRRRGGEEAKSGPKSEQQKGRSEEQLSVEPKESGVKRHSSSHNRHSSSSGRSQRDRATGYDAEAREGHQQNRGDGSNRQDDDPTASRRKTEREGQRAEVRGGDAEVRRRESDESRGGMSGTSQHRRTQRHSALDLDVGGGGRGSSQREKRGSRTKSERSVESGGGEEGVRREDGGESGQGEVMRGGSTREPTRQGSRSRANAVLSDGLDI